MGFLLLAILVLGGPGIVHMSKNDIEDRIAVNLHTAPEKALFWMSFILGPLYVAFLAASLLLACPWGTYLQWQKVYGSKEADNG